MTALALASALAAGAAAGEDKDFAKDFLDREIRRTQPDYVVYRPHAEKGFDDHGNEHLHVFRVRGTLCALWTMSAYEGTHTQRPVFATSRDDGRTWTAPKCILKDPIDPKTGRNMGSWAAPAVSKSGRIYVLYAKHLGDGTDHETGKMMVLCSDDLGETWSDEAPFPMPHDPRYDLETPAKPVSLFPWQDALRLSDGTVLFALSHNWKNPKANPEPKHWWPEHPSGCEIMRLDNIDDDPPPAGLKASFFARGENSLNAPLRTDPSRRTGEEPSLVELPDGRLMCTFRTAEGHVWYSVSSDRGETWRPCEMLRYTDGGEGVRHPLSPCPLYRISEKEYVLFIHDNDGFNGKERPQTDWNWRNPLHVLKGEFRPGAHQPVWFSRPGRIMDNGGVAIARKDLAMYADLTVEKDGPVLWYPDRKFFLLGRRLAPALTWLRPSSAPARWTADVGRAGLTFTVDFDEPLAGLKDEPENEIEIFFQPHDFGGRYYQFYGNPVEETVEPYYWAKGGDYVRFDDWSAEYLCRTGQGWRVTVRVPWGDLRKRPPLTGETWRIAVARTRAGEGLAISSGSPHEPKTWAEHRFAPVSADAAAAARLEIAAAEARGPKAKPRIWAKPGEKLPITTPCPKLDPDGEEKWGERQRALLRHARVARMVREGRTPRVFFLGDSITQGLGGRPWKRLEKFAPANLGVSGDWIENVLWRIDLGMFDLVKPEALVLLIGTNNGGCAPEQRAAGVAAIVRKIQEKSPGTRILLYGIFPRGKTWPAEGNGIKDTNALLAKLADGDRVRYADIAEKFLAADGKTVRQELFLDGLHPNEKGNGLWVDSLERELPALMRPAGPADTNGERR